MRFVLEVLSNICSCQANKISWVEKGTCRYNQPTGYIIQHQPRDNLRRSVYGHWCDNETKMFTLPALDTDPEISPGYVLCVKSRYLVKPLEETLSFLLFQISSNSKPIQLGNRSKLSKHAMIDCSGTEDPLPLWLTSLCPYTLCGTILMRVLLPSSLTRKH